MLAKDGKWVVVPGFDNLCQIGVVDGGAAAAGNWRV
jgi:hypothetical protein